MLNSGYTGKIEDLFCSALKTGGNEPEEIVWEDESFSESEYSDSSSARSPSPPPRKASPDLPHQRKMSVKAAHQRSPSADPRVRSSMRPFSPLGSMLRDSMFRRSHSDEPSRPKSASLWKSPPHAAKRLASSVMGPSRPSSALPRASLHKDPVAPYWEICCVIPGRLSLSIHRSVAHTSGQQTRDAQRHFFSSGVQDRSHMTVTCVVEFCEIIDKKMTDPRLESKHMIYYTGPSQESRYNAAFLMGSYLVTKCGKSAAEAAKCFEKSRGFKLGTISMPERAPQGYDLELKGCLFALHRAFSLGWFHLVTSMVLERERMAKDLNMQQIIPNIYVFNAPVSGELMHSFFEDPFSGGGRVYGPEKFLETFYEKHIMTVVQLDKVQYETAAFTDRGIRCVDMNFEDDKAPPPHLMRRFLKLMHQLPRGASVGVHSKRGMGRAGTIIAMYLMEQFLMTATEAMSWLRLVRPGMVVGQQQQWIFSKEDPTHRPWHLKNEIVPAPKTVAAEPQAPMSPIPALLGAARTPSLEERAVRAAAEAVSPGPRQLSANPRLRSVVDQMRAVQHAWGTLKGRTSLGPTSSSGSLSGKKGFRAAALAVPKPQKPPERRKNVHTIQIGSGDNIKTVQWTEVESDQEN